MKQQNRRSAVGALAAPINSQKKSQPKSYPIHDCALYSIQGFGQLRSVLQWPGTIEELRRLATAPESYTEIAVTHANKPRTVHIPIWRLSVVQARIATLLRRIEPPMYRQSGVKGRSFLSNAGAHENPMPGITVDIKKYFWSTKHAHVKNFFGSRMKCADDVSSLLALICCYMGKHLPIGGKHSEEVAFHCHQPAFDEIFKKVQQRDGIVTTYVDDVSISMPHASPSDLGWIAQVFARHHLNIHPVKSRAFRSNEKIVTGVAIRNGKMRGTNAMHFRAKQAQQDLDNATTNSSKRISLVRIFLGRIGLLAHIDRRLMERHKRARKRFSSLISRAQRGTSKRHRPSSNPRQADTSKLERRACD